jgi:Tol biopolymer transport system component
MQQTQWRLAIAGALLALGVIPAAVEAQYFGRNKVQYRTFDFEVLATDRFDIYYYPEEVEAARIVARLAERWHSRLSRFFGHDLRGRQPLILYAASSHFRQTNAIEGLIGEGTGGVTEAIKRRIVLPMSGSLADTNHVLGHELVHAFQFDLTGADPREAEFTAPEILQFPLWFVEGMAEYLTLGPIDGQTSMWLRDAALREKLPHIKDLDHWRYFPYRWGHAFWAYIGARFGDRAVASLIRSSANPRHDLMGLARQLGTDPDTLTAEWHKAILESTRAVADAREPLTSRMKLAISEETGSGRFNIGPRVSPDGRSLAFFSERDRFSIELYLADAESGRIRRKLVRSASDPHFDSLEFLNSAGAWSPDGRSLVIAAVRRGKSILAFVDPQNGRVTRELLLAGLDDALNPAFAPDGKSVVVSGNRGGLVDLYRVSLETGVLDRLTDDPGADLEPTFTPDGRTIVFVTERFSVDLATLDTGPLRLARLDLASREVYPIAAFRAGKHLSPQVSPDGRMLTFVAEPDGISNLYRMPIDGGPIERLTSIVTGVAGITSTSPALSASASGRLAFSVFENDGHAIYLLEPEDLVGLVAPEATNQAALLPGRTSPSGDVLRLLNDHARGLPATAPAAPGVPYTHKLRLDMIGQPTITAGTGEFGGFVSGSISAFFSDMLGDRSLGVAAQVGGDLADFGGVLQYINRRHRWNWAAVLEAVPYLTGELTYEEDEAAREIWLTEVIERQTSRGAFGVAAYPFSPSTRIEVLGGARALAFTRDRRTRVYSADTREFIERRESRESAAPTLYLAETSVALVRDTSYFGATGPIFGTRARLEVGQLSGSIRQTSLLADYRRYFMPVRPVTIAVRALHFGRYGRDAQHSQIVDLYAGYPEFVHGYGVGSFSAADCTNTGEGRECSVFRNLIGSRMAVANVEVRAPLVGLFTGDLDYGRLPIEVVGFFDSALTWTAAELPSFAGGPRQVVRSYGAAARFNAFGLMVLEAAASRPLDRPDRSWKWQIGIRQGF